MLDIVAFEGNKSPTDGVTWGAAAIMSGRLLINAFSRSHCPSSDLDELVAEGVLVPLPSPVSIDADAAKGSVCVLAFTKHSRWVQCLTPLRKGELGTIDDEQCFYSIYPNREALKTRARLAVDRLMNAALYKEWENAAEVNELIRIGMTLDRTHPALNAIWAYRHADNALVARMAEMHVSNSERTEFVALLQSLRETQVEKVELAFEGGEANEGGFSVSTTNALLNSLDNVFSFEAARAANNYSFFSEDEITPMAFRERRAASVHWTFSLVRDGDTFGDRFARTFVLGRVREGLRTGAANIDERSAKEAYQRLTRPAEGSSLSVRFADTVEQSSAVAGLRGEHLWFKRLSLSDAQIVQQGRPVPYLRLTRSNHDIDYVTWFRQTLFAGLEWRNGQFGKSAVEIAEANFSVRIQGIPLGQMAFQITHAATRARENAHGHPATWLHWNPQLISAFASGFYAYHWVWLERTGTELFLTIDAAPPR